ncbi:hypothetical protein BJP35_2927 [Enterobacter sp. J49]|nr:hypothetical protein BJP35_2927 [Enterobacter sp. J49]CZW30379.1 Uncharacterised protein [Enterobacter hormaechei]VAC60966.1 Uncharacterised protein [Enterobacter hormaechei]
MKKHKFKKNIYSPKCQPIRPVGWHINLVGRALFKGTD